MAARAADMASNKETAHCGQSGRIPASSSLALPSIAFIICEDLMAEELIAVNGKK